MVLGAAGRFGYADKPAGSREKHRLAGSAAGDLALQSALPIKWRNQVYKDFFQCNLCIRASFR
jgi:hypothetical protein